MPIEAVKIPQNVYVEDRIIGPVTLKQLIITGIGGGISYVLYASVTKAGITNLPAVILCWVPAVIAAAFAFMKINDLTLFNIILLAIESMSKPNLRYWSPSPGLSINLITRQSDKEFQMATAKAELNATRLNEITHQLKQHQEEMSRIAGHESMPEDTDAVKTRFESAAGPVNPATGSDREPASEQYKPAIDPSAVSIGSGLDPARSIDAVAASVGAYDHLIAKSSD